MPTTLPDDAVNRFKRVLSLPPETLAKLNVWLKTNVKLVADGIPEDSELKSAAAELGVRKSDLRIALSFAGSMTVGGFTPADLEEVGLGEQLEKAKLLLGGVEIPKKEAEYVRQKVLTLQSVVPTLEGADGLCELRAVFGSLPSPAESDEHTTNVKTLLGFEPVALISLFLSDAADNETTCVFQVPERGLRNLLRTLQQLVTQLEIVRETHRKEMLNSKGVS